MQTICNTKLAASSEKEEQFVELGQVSELTLGFYPEVPEGNGRFTYIIHYGR